MALGVNRKSINHLIYSPNQELTQAKSISFSQGELIEIIELFKIFRMHYNYYRTGHSKQLAQLQRDCWQSLQMYRKSIREAGGLT